MPIVLHVGCGPKSIKHIGPYFQSDDWKEIRLDIDPGVKPDVIGSLTDMSAVPTGSVDALFSSHNIEHLFWHEVPTALAEFHRVLSNDGFAFIRCPDLQKIAALVAEDKLLDPAYMSGLGPIAPMDVIYGFGQSIKNGNHYMAHRCGFTQTTLHRTLLAAGFTTAAVGRLGLFELAALATKNMLSPDERRELFGRLYA